MRVSASCPAGGGANCETPRNDWVLRPLHPLDEPGDDGLPAVLGEADGELAVGPSARALLDLPHAERPVPHQRAAGEDGIVVPLVVEVIHRLVVIVWVWRIRRAGRRR